MGARAGWLLVAWLVLACSAPGRTPATEPTSAAPSGSDVPVVPSPGPTAWPRPSVATMPSPVAGGPPDASLGAEGGDPVAGQLGTYVWRDGGSDSPWLPGAPLAVGAREPLSITFEPDISIASWVARAVPADAPGPQGATPLGRGDGRPAFTAPDTGAWTIEVHVVFDGDLGEASYFWRLEVSR